MLAYLRLFRLPNVFTAMADVLMGYAFVQPSLGSVWWTRLTLVLASSCLYTAGMVLNDVYDIDIDRVERPERPLPSGRIDWGWARRVGYALLLSGIGLAWLTLLLVGDRAALPWRAGVVGTVLACCVVAYDAGLKRTFVGPLVMGSCRFFNVLLGMSLAGTVRQGLPSALWFEPSQLLVAGGIGTYIVGVTWFARTEATTSQRLPLILAVVVMGVGAAQLAIFPDFAREYGRAWFKQPVLWPALVATMFVPIARRCLSAIMNPSPQRVQAAVKNCIVSLIIFDASVCVAVGASEWAFITIALLVPMLVLGRWVYST